MHFATHTLKISWKGLHNVIYKVKCIKFLILTLFEIFILLDSTSALTTTFTGCHLIFYKVLLWAVKYFWPCADAHSPAKSSEFTRICRNLFSGLIQHYLILGMISVTIVQTPSLFKGGGVNFKYVPGSGGIWKIIFNIFEVYHFYI